MNVKNQTLKSVFGLCVSLVIWTLTSGFLHTILPGPVYAEETVVLIRCADPRINEACTRLLNPGERSTVISNTGSIKYFLLNDRLSDLYGQIRLLVHKFGIKKLIITNHTHCGFYKQLSLGEEAETADLRATRVKLQKTFPEVEVESYMVDTETLAATLVE